MPFAIEAVCIAARKGQPKRAVYARALELARDEGKGHV